jgi:hypothetical protein
LETQVPVTDHVDHNLYSRSHAEYRNRHADDGDSGRRAANQGKQEEGDKHDESLRVKAHRQSFAQSIGRTKSIRRASATCPSSISLVGTRAELMVLAVATGLKVHRGRSP